MKYKTEVAKHMFHDYYVDVLYKRLEGWKFDHIDKFVPYDHGEVDILAKLGDVLFDFEVKCSKKHRKKGESQLYRWRKYMAIEGSRLNTHGFLYIGNEDFLDLIF
jgi:hypothetical protein